MSGAYLSLLRIVAEHAFFPPASGILRLEPTTHCKVLCEKFGFLLRPAPNGIDLFCHVESRNELLSGDWTDPDLQLEFSGYSEDANFSVYTDPVARCGEDWIFLHGGATVRQADGRFRLHQDEQVTAAVFRKSSDADVMRLLGKKFEPVKPVFFVVITFADLAKALRELETSANGQNAPTYYLRFGARKSLWKYYFLNDIGRGMNLAIVDLDGRTRFTSQGITALPGKRDALTFVSDKAIDMVQTYPQRFQLREQGEFGERILIKRLPNASIGGVGRELVEGSAVLVSEIYIN